LTQTPNNFQDIEVGNLFDSDRLSHFCETWDFSDYATRVELEDAFGGRPRFFWHADNGADVLAVAHLDTVQEDRSCHVEDTSEGLIAWSGGLDDRLGVYVILDLLPKLGINVDLLLTTDEEIGQSTAGDFTTSKSYNWMIEFDRGGTDVVMYHYETDELAAAVAATGAEVGEGINSDITYLSHLGCAGINWGVGYRRYHSTDSHAFLNDTFHMVSLFKRFWDENHELRWSYDPSNYRYGYM